MRTARIFSRAAPAVRYRAAASRSARGHARGRAVWHREASYDPDGEQALGKTGTCNDEELGGRLGWFVSYADQAHPKIVLVVLLHGGSRIISGPHASEIAGRIYRGLRERNYFAGAPLTRESPGLYPDPAAEIKTVAGTPDPSSTIR